MRSSTCWVRCPPRTPVRKPLRWRELLFAILKRLRAADISLLNPRTVVVQGTRSSELIA